MTAVTIDVEAEFSRLAEVFEAFEALRSGPRRPHSPRGRRVRLERRAAPLSHRPRDRSRLPAREVAGERQGAPRAGRGRARGARGRGARQRRDPAGRGGSPAHGAPRRRGEPEFLAMELGQNRTTLEELRALGTSIADAKGWIPHQELGTLAAPHWLRFVRAARAPPLGDRARRAGRLSPPSRRTAAAYCARLLARAAAVPPLSGHAVPSKNADPAPGSKDSWQRHGTYDVAFVAASRPDEAPFTSSPVRLRARRLRRTDHRAACRRWPGEAVPRRAGPMSGPARS